jgi:hypothetical protein
VKRRNRVALPSAYATTIGAEPTVTHRCTTLDETVLGALRTQLGRDPLADVPIGGDHAEVGEEQRAMLNLEATPQLGVLHHRAIAHHQMLPALARQSRLVALVEPLGVTLEERRRRCHRQLDERRSVTGTHHVHQPVHRRFALVLKVIEHLDPLDESGLLLQT